MGGHEQGLPRGAGDTFTSQSGPQQTLLSEPHALDLEVGVAAPSCRAIGSIRARDSAAGLGSDPSCAAIWLQSRASH